MSARFPYDPFARPELPDVRLPEVKFDRAPRFTFAKALKVVLAFLAAILVLSMILFVPVLAGQVARIDAIMLAGELLPAYSFADRLLDLFFGTFIVASAVLSFLAAVALSAGSDDDPFPQPLDARRDAATSKAGHRELVGKVKHV